MTQTDSSLYNIYPLGQDSTAQLAYQDCVVKSGIDPGIYRLDFEPASGRAVYDLLYRDTDPTTNSSGGSAQAKRNYTKCEDAGGWIANGRFRQLDGSPIAFDKKGRPRKYFQPQGKPLEIFFPSVTVAVWELVSHKSGLSMPEFPVVGLNGEAIGFWEWVKITNCPIVITEGEKKAAALISRGYAAIGLPGIHTGYRVTERGDWVTKPDGTQYQKAAARELHAALQPLDTVERQITIIFDYRVGDYSQSQEFKAASTLSKLFKSAIAKIGKLPGPAKGVDDFSVAGGDIDAVIAEACQETSEDWKLQKWLRLRGFTPDRTINSEWFDAPAPESGTVTAIKSGLGTGKTEFIKNKVASDARGLQINLGYRNSLLLQQCEKWGSNHWDEHKGYLFTKDPDGRLSLCVDSLLKLPIEMFEYAVQHVRGMTVIFDESVSAIKHALTSSTLFGKRLEILERLEIICKLADRIILSDGNQSDIVVDYIAKISGKRSVKIENVFTGNTPPIFFVNTGKKSKKWLSAEIIKSPCPAVATDSLRDAEALAQRLHESHGPGLLLTSKTVTEGRAKEFLKDPDAYIQKYKPAWLIFSPTAESGIDISIRDYFSDVFCWFVGVLGVDEAVQISRRVRHPERIIVLCPERGLASRSGGGMFEAEIIKALAEFGDTEARLLVEDESQLQKIREDLAAQIVTPHTILWAKLQAKAELERANLRDYLLKAFELGGYSVQQVSAAECSDDGHAVAKEECKDKESQEIFNAPDISLSEALEIKRNYSAAWPERCQSIKALLKARLPGIEDSELWSWQFVRRVRFDERSLLSQLDAAWQFENPEDAEYLQRSRLLAGKREFLGDFSNRYLKIRALQALGLEKFLDSSKDWSGDDFEVVQLYERCKKKAIANLLGHPGKMKPMQWLNRLLSLTGFKLIGRRTKRNGVLHWKYSFDDELSTPKDWDELAAMTAKKQAKKIAELKEAELLAVQALEAVPPPPVFDTNLGVGGTIPDMETETPIQSDPTPPIASQTGWVSRWGQWVVAKVVGWCEEGTRYRILYQTKCGEWDEALAFPEYMRWEAPT
ncbi:plasmid replication protein, CyRepA1 family [Microcoleus sp. herbarium14]|uniref:plasmid replication protein, CyRepA1 family n=1 Tax=Microcoleus sp. herbarium14 TaxID=3055439 RepID=UPI002FD5D382